MSSLLLALATLIMHLCSGCGASTPAVESQPPDVDEASTEPSPVEEDGHTLPVRVASTLRSAHLESLLSMDTSQIDELWGIFGERTALDPVESMTVLPSMEWPYPGPNHFREGYGYHWTSIRFGDETSFEELRAVVEGAGYERVGCGDLIDDRMGGMVDLPEGGPTHSCLPICFERDDETIHDSDRETVILVDGWRLLIIVGSIFSRESRGSSASEDLATVITDVFGDVLPQEDLALLNLFDIRSIYRGRPYYEDTIVAVRVRYGVGRTSILETFQAQGWQFFPWNPEGRDGVRWVNARRSLRDLGLELVFLFEQATLP